MVRRPTRTSVSQEEHKHLWPLVLQPRSLQNCFCFLINENEKKRIYKATRQVNVETMPDIMVPTLAPAFSEEVAVAATFDFPLARSIAAISPLTPPSCATVWNAARTLYTGQLHPCGLLVQGVVGGGKLALHDAHEGVALHEVLCVLGGTVHGRHHTQEGSVVVAVNIGNGLFCRYLIPTVDTVVDSVIPRQNPAALEPRLNLVRLGLVARVLRHGKHPRSEI
ncbi:hypothetical protein BC830DRAFT_88263 [Chytriomyces sp. MP71]|nr:hypothetical protein BC830DRAFT_88263 [Chytriomyces sp. MP71]